MSGPALRLREATFAYRLGDESAVGVFEVSLEVARGASLALVGANGSGKTTLLRLAAGERHASAGSVEACGLDPARAPRRQLAQRVAVVAAQPPVAHFGYTVEELVLMGRAPWMEPGGLESDEDLAAAADAMQAMDVAHLAGRDVQQLSMGERQRVAVARALAQQPELLLLDEPSAFLDIRHVLQFHEMLQQMGRERDLAVVCAMHDLNLAARYFDRVAMMRSGRLVALGNPSEVLTPSNVRDVFDAEVQVLRDPATGAMHVLPRSGGAWRPRDPGTEGS